MSKGTIFYIGGFEMPDRNAAAHRVLNNAKIFRKMGYDVVFLGVDRQIDQQIDLQTGAGQPFAGEKTDVLKTRTSFQGFDCWSIPYPVSNGQWIRYLSSIDSFTRVISQYKDVKAVICYNYQSLAMVKIRGYCWKNKIKLLADCTEWYSTKGANIVFKVLKGLDSMVRMRFVQKQLDGIIVISKYLRNYYAASKNVVCIPPLVDLSEEKWNRASNTGDTAGKIKLVYSGSPSKNKEMLDFVLDLLYQLKDRQNFIFYIIGITKDQFLSIYGDSEIIAGHLQGNVIFLGRLSHDKSLQYIASADFSMLVRDDTRMNKAGFPTKFVESISCGTPVITNRTSDLEDYVKEGENGFFIDIRNKQASLDIMNRILAMPSDEITRMKNYCLESRVFHYENYIGQMNEFFKKLFKTEQE
ncbi:MAG: glycosyltransferase [Saccharofermentanales bacterium]